MSIEIQKCKFCQIINQQIPAYTVFEDDIACAFLDIRPLFTGHVLLVPKLHVEILSDLPDELAGPFFRIVKTLSRIVPEAMKAQGSFVAVNNKVSQSVPHMHVHVVPRNKGDGLKGFFWPRQGSIEDKKFKEAQSAIIAAIERQKSI